MRRDLAFMAVLCLAGALAGLVDGCAPAPPLVGVPEPARVLPVAVLHSPDAVLLLPVAVLQAPVALLYAPVAVLPSPDALLM